MHHPLKPDLAPWPRRTFATALAAAVPLAYMNTRNQTTSASDPKTVAEPNASGRITYVFVPHPDDAVIRLSHYLVFAAHRGDRIVIVTITDGSSTSVRNRLGLTRKEITRVRYIEQEAAMRFLTDGKAEFIRLGYQDGSARWIDIYDDMRGIIGSPAQGKEIYVASWHHDSPESVHGDKHTDHVAAVLAAREFAEEGHVVRYGRHPLSKATRGTKYFAASTVDKLMVEGAVNAYRPIGWRSVPEELRPVLSTRNAVTS